MNTLNTFSRYVAAAAAAAADQSIYIQLTVAVQGAGAITFAMTLLAFYLLFTMLLESVDFPLTLPVGDLSTRFKGKRARMLDRARGGIPTEEV